MRRKAFWGQKGSIRRACPRAIDGRLFDAVIGSQGVGIFAQGTHLWQGGLTWEEVIRLAQGRPLLPLGERTNSPLEQLGAALAERSEPRILPVEESK